MGLGLAVGCVDLGPCTLVLLGTRPTARISRSTWLGSVPQNRLDAALMPTWVYPASIATLILAGAALLALIYNSTKLLYDIGVSNIKWSSVWTTVSILIPFINFYRPWVGLNETERTLKFLSDKQAINNPEIISARREFGVPTFLYAILFFVLSIGDKIILSLSKEIDSENISSQFEFYRFSDRWEIFLLVVFCASLFGLFMNLLYWEAIFKKCAPPLRKSGFNLGGPGTQRCHPSL